MSEADIEITLNRTCYACPEQYDAVDQGGNVVGYLRLRHGHFTVQVPDSRGEVVYSASPDGDGIFGPAERERYLSAALAAIRDRIAGSSPACRAARLLAEYRATGGQWNRADSSFNHERWIAEAAELLGRMAGEQ